MRRQWVRHEFKCLEPVQCATVTVKDVLAALDTQSNFEPWTPKDRGYRDYVLPLRWAVGLAHMDANPMPTGERWRVYGRWVGPVWKGYRKEFIELTY